MTAQTMQFVEFSVGDTRIAMESSHVVEVLPLVNWTAIDSAGDGIVGLMVYHGHPVRVLDLAIGLVGRPSRSSMNARILLVRRPESDGAMESQCLAIIAERVHGVQRRDPRAYRPFVGIESSTVGLGEIFSDSNGIVRRLSLDGLMPHATMTP
ncbi:MAG: chemotaxis protein CheW [Gemmatimonadales bacterium]